VASYPDTRILIVTHVRVLIAQNHAALIRLWPDVPAGIYTAGLGKRQLGRQILVAGVQSVARRARDPTSPKKSASEKPSRPQLARSVGEPRRAIVEAGDRHPAGLVAGRQHVAGVARRRECRSRAASAITISSPQRPRRLVVIAGVLPAEMAVSQTSATSARSSLAFARRNGGRLTPPDSSSPSSRIATGIGKLPVTAFQARQASTKVLS
jgi:hypothetical protein